MPERSITPEALEMLPEAVEEVKGLYLGDELSNLLGGTQSLQQRDEFWEETAKRFEPFSEKITRLREALKTAYVTERAYDELVKNLMRSHFSEVDDLAARELLTHILYARTRRSPGYMDYNMVVVIEAKAMIEELGVRGGLRDKALKEIKLDDVIKRVLRGDLKLSRQTQFVNRAQKAIGGGRL